MPQTSGQYKHGECYIVILLNQKSEIHITLWDLLSFALASAHTTDLSFTSDLRKFT